MSETIDQVDAKLLDALQAGVPLVARPFAALGERVGTSEDDALARVQALKNGRDGKRGVIRQISAIFDTKALGYASTLVAAKIPAGHIERAAATISAHPGVSHNYQREHAFNLWYTLAVPPDSKLGLDKTLEVLHQQSGAESTRKLPTLRLFKIGVRLAMSDDASEAPAPAPTYSSQQQNEAAANPPSAEEKQAIRVLQQDLPLEPQPFDAWAEQAGMPRDALLAAAQSFLDRHMMRRFAAVLRHREAGFSANAMGIWQVPEGDREAFGTKAATWPAVTHCYERPTYPDFPYAIFTMIHGKSSEDCEKVMADISAATGVTTYAALYSTREFKKTRVKYFTPETAAWEAAALG